MRDLPATSTADSDRHPFLKLMPQAQGHARRVFRFLRGPDFDDAVADSVADAFVNFTALSSRGIDPMTVSGCLCRYAASHTRGGRSVGNRQNGCDVFSRKARCSGGFRLESLCKDALADHRTPIPDQVAFRVDFDVFLRSLPPRDRLMALALAVGTPAVDVARDFGVTPGRVTQLRKSWLDRWVAFLGCAE